MKLAQIIFALEMVASIFGLPYCIWVIIAAARPGIPSVTEASKGGVMWIPLAIIVLGVISLALKGNIVGKLIGSARGWAVGMIAIAFLVTLLLMADSPKIGG
jgi:hypothetical protein